MKKRIMIALLTTLFLTTAVRIGEAQNASADIAIHVTTEDCMTISVPQVVGLRNEQAQQRINHAIQARIDQFKTEMRNMPYVREAIVRCEVHYNQDNLLSLTLLFYNYTGGAHGMSYLHGLTFDLRNGREYKLRDFIPLNSGNKQWIDRAVTDYVQERQIPLLGPYNGLRDIPDFFLSRNGQPVVFFQLYEIAPYSAGFVRVPLDIKIGCPGTIVE